MVTWKHKPFCTPELGELEKANIVEQPENRGTGIAISTTILMLLKRDAGAFVALFPWDHHYDDEPAFLRTVDAGILTAMNTPDRIVLLGVEPTYPETDYGLLALAAGLSRNDFESSYRSVSSVDFSRDIVASQTERLLVIRDSLSGWTDLGTPNRIFETLGRQGADSNSGYELGGPYE